MVRIDFNRLRFLVIDDNKTRSRRAGAVRIVELLLQVDGDGSRSCGTARLCRRRQRRGAELFRAAHDIKGEATTFGLPQIEPVARARAG